MKKRNRISASMMALFAAIPLWASAQINIETVHQFEADMPPGNIAISPDGRLFMSVHEFYGHPLKVVEVNKDGSTTPYPTEAWAYAPEGDGAGLNGVLGLRADRQGILWMLDAKTKTHDGRLVAWDTNTESLHRIVYLSEPVARAESFLNDLAVDRTNEAVYITDTSSPTTSALIVVNLETGQARRVLDGSKFTVPEDIDMVIDGKTVTLGGGAARIGANPITLDPTDTWVYFAPMTGTSMYRVKTADLLNFDLSQDELANRVERYGDKPISDGSTVDSGGNVYVTSITDNSIGIVQPDGSYKTLVKRDDISWPDGFAYGPDNKVYVTVNELHRSPVLNGGVDATKGVFSIMRFDALDDGTSGR